MKRTVLKYTGSKTSAELGSAMVPESTLIVTKAMVARVKAKAKLD